VLYIIWVLLGFRDQNTRVRSGREEDEFLLDMMYKKLFIVFMSAVIFCFAFWVTEVYVTFDMSVTS
jgi:hypothetical protein